MAHVKNFTSFINAKNRMLREEADVMLTDKTLVDLSAKIQQYKNQINQWERDIENRKKILADEAAKKEAASAAQPTQQVAQAPPTA